VVVAPAQGRERRSGADTLAAGGDTTTADDSALARMSHALQEQIRRELWGAAWERMRDAAARLAQAPASARGSSRHADAGARKGAPDGDDGDAGEPWEEARAAGDLGARRDAQAAATGRGFERRDDPEADSPSEHDTEDEGGAGDGADAQPARAGNDTDPAHLFGAPSEGSGSDTGAFPPAQRARPHPWRRNQTQRRRRAPAGTRPGSPRAARGRAVRGCGCPPHESIVREAHIGQRQDARP
jgi:hypothetical protein